MKNNLEQPITIVCASDNAYAIPLTAMLASLVSNLNTDSDTEIHIISDGISRIRKAKITKSNIKEKVKFVWHEFNSDIFKNFIGESKAYYLRLLIPKILPLEYKKCIYLDSDIIINSNIYDLWKFELGEHALAACQDQFSPLVSSPGGLLNYKILNLGDDTKCFNSGVLLYNLEIWRRDDISNLVIKYISNNKEYIRFWDQDGLNAMLSDRWLEIDGSWNHLLSPIFEQIHDEAALNKFYACYNEKIKILHFAAPIKPWNYGFDHPAKTIFFRYLDMTSWKGWRPSRRRHILKRLKNYYISFFG